MTAQGPAWCYCKQGSRCLLLTRKEVAQVGPSQADVLLAPSTQTKRHLDTKSSRHSASLAARGAPWATGWGAQPSRVSGSQVWPQGHAGPDHPIPTDAEQRTEQGKAPFALTEEMSTCSKWYRSQRWWFLYTVYKVTVGLTDSLLRGLRNLPEVKKYKISSISMKQTGNCTQFHQRGGLKKKIIHIAERYFG